MEPTLDKILLVDDNPNLLASIERELFDEYEIFKALSGREALDILVKKGPFAVIISDMRMPEMDGIQFLSKAAKIHPQTVRIMLTGNSDLTSAIAAVNQGCVFRFMTKPCPIEVLRNILKAGVAQYNLVIHEKKLLKDTFVASINVLINVLSLTHPECYSRSLGVRKIATRFTDYMMLKDAWQYQSAAMLSQIGCISVPSYIMEKKYSGVPLSPSENILFMKHPSDGYHLLDHIPRLDQVALMIREQFSNYDELVRLGNEQGTSVVVLGASIIRASTKINSMLSKELSRHSIISKIKEDHLLYHPKIVQVTQEIELTRYDKKVELISICQLDKDMILERDIVSRDKTLIAAKGQRYSLPFKVLLANHLEAGMIDEPILVSMPGAHIE